jgi:peptide/nickel transport system ATP-binding protein/oligopeptide transport system ATP-binding protein
MPSLPDDIVLSVSGLTTHFPTEGGVVRSAEEVGLSLARGETLAVVGESGSGKSVMCLSILGLIERPGQIVSGDILFRRRSGEIVDLRGLSERALQGVRGDEIAMIFQEPMTSLNPLYPVGEQIAETIRAHRGLGRREAWAEAARLLSEVGIADAERRASDYPHQMSGGMRQRVMIAMALACRPSVLIADEPTTALDVTIQAQILDLLRGLKASSAGMGILFVTHDMGVVAQMADRVMVMYGGRVVESAPARAIFAHPLHPYTKGLLASIPRRGRGRRAREPLQAIPGNVPRPLDLPPGCAFAPRCPMAREACGRALPPLAEPEPGRATRCFFWEEL